MGVHDYGTRQCSQADYELLNKISELNNNVRANNALLVQIMCKLEGNENEAGEPEKNRAAYK